MTEQKEVYLIIFSPPSDDCPRTHVSLFNSEAELKARLPDDYKPYEGQILVVHGVIVEERVAE